MTLAGTDDGLFDLSGPVPRQSLAGRSVAALAPGHDGGWWAIVGGEIVVSGDPGSGWREVTDVSTRGLTAHCLLPGPASVVVGTSEARLLRWDPSGLQPVGGFDAVPGRDEWYTPWGEPADVRSLAGDPDRPVVNVHVGGVWTSSDGGSTWRLAVEVDADTHQVVGSGDGELLVAAAVGFGRSGDGGRTWEWSTAGLHATYCRAVARVDGAVLLSASTGPGTREAAVYRLTEGSTSFERCTDGLPQWFDANVDTGCLAGSGQEAAIGTAAGDVFRSTDGGETWQQIAEGLPPVRAVAV